MNMFLKAIIIKTVWYWHQKGHIDQWNKFENPEINVHIYGQLIYDKSIQWGESPFNTLVLRKLTATCERIQLNHHLTPYKIMNSKWNKALNIGVETIKLLEEKHRQ